MIMGWGAFVFPISNLITYIVVRNQIQNSIPTTADINHGTFNGKPDNASADTHLGQHVPWLESLDSKEMHPKLKNEKSNKWAKHFVLEGKKSKTVRRGLKVEKIRDAVNKVFWNPFRNYGFSTDKPSNTKTSSSNGSKDRPPKNDCKTKEGSKVGFAGPAISLESSSSKGKKLIFLRSRNRTSKP